MAYADPQTINAVAHNRVGSAKPLTLGVFQDTTGNSELQVRQNLTSKRRRREVVLTVKKIAADPISAQNAEVSASVMIVVDQPRWGFSVADLETMENNLRTWFTASSNAARTKLLGGEL